MKRADALSAVLNQLPPAGAALFATGVISREAQACADRSANLYLMGSMGLISSVGLGLAMAQPNRMVVVVDGDGSLLMELASMCMVAHLSPHNYLHIVIDNEAYESTGGQETLSRAWLLSDTAQQIGYKHIVRALTAEQLGQAVRDFVVEPRGPGLVHAKTESRPETPFPPRIVLAPDALTERFRKAILK